MSGRHPTQAKPALSVARRAERLGAKLVGTGSVLIKGINAIELAGPEEITFLSDLRHTAKLAKSAAAAVIVGEISRGFRGSQLVVPDVGEALIETLKIFAPPLAAPAAGVHTTAVVSPRASVAVDSSIGLWVVIEDFVEIVANCCVDRAKFGNTVIGAGTKIDNLVQIAHNVVIGRCCLIAAQVGIAGSARLGDGVVLGGQAGVVDNKQIGAGAMIGGQSAVESNLPADGRFAGTPAIEANESMKLAVIARRLPKMRGAAKRAVQEAAEA